MAGEPWKPDDERQPRNMFEQMFGRARDLTEEEKAECVRQALEAKMSADLLGSLLPAYRPGRVCIKCGSTKTKTLYHRGMPTFDVSSCYAQVGEYEHLHRVCKRCGFTWYERPLSAEAS